MLPYFYHAQIPDSVAQSLELDENTSRHIAQVLRKQPGYQMVLADGKGKVAHAELNIAHKKHCLVNILNVTVHPPRPYSFSLAIAFTKNNNRNEWLLEKVTELGIENIYPVITERSEKQKFNIERWNNILVAAMLQSQQTYLPLLHEPIKFKNFIYRSLPGKKYIAHCDNAETRQPITLSLMMNNHVIALVGPEGDFTKEEVDFSRVSGFEPVSFGANRLRTETAGLYICTLFNASNYVQ